MSDLLSLSAWRLKLVLALALVVGACSSPHAPDPSPLVPLSDAGQKTLQRLWSQQLQSVNYPAELTQQGDRVVVGGDDGQVFTARLDDGRVVPAFIGQALKGEDFTVFGEGKQTRSFCYVTDLIDGICRLMLSEESEPTNIGNPRELTMLEFAEAVRKAAGGGGRIVHRPMPKDDPKQRRPDIGKAQTVLGWEPKVSLEDGLRETIAYFKKVVGARTHP